MATGSGMALRLCPNQENQRELLEEQLRKSQCECLVCCENIRVRDAIWSCRSCFNVFHLKCIRTWANSEAAACPGSSSSEASSGCWRCPACQSSRRRVPNRYYCFCGKVRDPEFNRYLVPHSCGEVCQKSRKDNAGRKYQCPHRCYMYCHPGPCPPCQARVTRRCACGKTVKSVSCAQDDEDVDCSNTCDKTLDCGLHRCEQKCHFGECLSCPESKTQVCFCGQDKKQIKCGQTIEAHRCQKKCAKSLSCGNHFCQELCHDDQCQPCLLDPQFSTHCPCSKTELKNLKLVKRTSCLDPIPTCGQICQKTLDCGPVDDHHSCKSECHNGPCPVCDEKTVLRCGCGANFKSIKCSELIDDAKNFVCKKRCNKKLQCKRHKCLNECCFDSEHRCDQLCGRKLVCGQHTCQEPCHFNKCPTCWNVSWDELTCRCGLSVILPPVACGTKRPECNEICSRVHLCGHEVTHPCHDDDSCPPCTVLVSKMCYGQHEMRAFVPCFQDGASCGKICNILMPCGMHTCQKICHPGDCGACSLPCTKKRTDCEHNCGLKCHQTTSADCPDVKCKVMLKVNCPCGRKSDLMPCFKINDESTIRLSAKFLADVRIKAGESININEVVKSAMDNKLCRLKCDEVCAVYERNKQLAEALNIPDADFSPNPGPPNYSDVLKDAALSEPDFVNDVYEIIKKLVIESKQCKLSFKNYNFSPMNSYHRQIVHELAQHFGCKTSAIDKEPNRSVIVKAVTGKCYLPTVSLMEFIKKEDVRPSNSSKIKLKSCSFDQELKTKTELKRPVWEEDEHLKEEKIDYFDFEAD